MMKGQTLVEALVALGIGVLIISAIAIAILSSLNNAQYSKSQNLASGYAQEGMETARKIRDNDWTTFNNYDGSYCLDKGTTILVEKDPPLAGGCPHGSVMSQNLDIFARQIDIEQDSADCKLSPFPSPTPSPMPSNPTRVRVIVSWSDNKCTDVNNVYCHNVTLTSCFSDANVISAP